MCYHIKEMCPRLFHLDTPKSSFEDERTNGVTNQGSEHIQMLLGDTLKLQYNIFSKRSSINDVTIGGGI